MNKSNEIPSVLAFEKKIAPSDGYMYGTVWTKRNTDEHIPLKLQEKAVRGTVSNRLKSKEAENIEAKIEKPNLQRVDTCSLGVDHDTLKLQFTLKILGGLDKPSACNKPHFERSCAEKVQGYTKQYAFHDLAYRYAHNLACARFLWRNRVGAEKIETRIQVLGSSSKKGEGSNKEWIFDGYKSTLQDFDSSEEKEPIKDLGKCIADIFCDPKSFLLLKVSSSALLGSKQEVYPSEELVLDQAKEKDSKSRVLYAVNDIASMHSQKIGNALRTIDTWYPDFEDSIMGPIAVEPYGSVTNQGKAYRDPSSKCDFYHLFDNWVLGKKELSETEQHYVMAVLIRGGVFGKSDKKNNS